VQQYVLLPRLRTEHERERQPGGGQVSAHVGLGLDVPGAVVTEHEHRVVRRADPSCGDEYLCQARVRPRERLRPQVLRGAWLDGVADQARRQRGVQSHEDVEVVLEQHHHVDPTQQLAQQDPLVDPLAVTVGVADIRDLLPVLPPGPLIVAPEGAAGVQLGPVDQGFGEAARGPVRRAPCEVLAYVEAKREGERLVLDGGQIKPGGGRYTTVGKVHEVVDR
jgi:hypothetical protein